MIFHLFANKCSWTNINKCYCWCAWVCRLRSILTEMNIADIITDNKQARLIHIYVCDWYTSSCMPCVFWLACTHPPSQPTTILWITLFTELDNSTRASFIWCFLKFLAVRLHTHITYNTPTCSVSQPIIEIFAKIAMLIATLPIRTANYHAVWENH